MLKNKLRKPLKQCVSHKLVKGKEGNKEKKVHSNRRKKSIKKAE